MRVDSSLPLPLLCERFFTLHPLVSRVYHPALAVPARPSLSLLLDRRKCTPLFCVLLAGYVYACEMKKGGHIETDDKKERKSGFFASWLGLRRLTDIV